MECNTSKPFKRSGSLAFSFVSELLMGHVQVRLATYLSAKCGNVTDDIPAITRGDVGIDLDSSL